MTTSARLRKAVVSLLVAHVFALALSTSSDIAAKSSLPSPPPSIRTSRLSATQQEIVPEVAAGLPASTDSHQILVPLVVADWFPSETVIPLPGRIEAEDYRSGGQGHGYFDTTEGNEGGAYRRDDVDIGQPGGASGAHAVGWVKAGEWLAYNVNFERRGYYVFEVRLATPDGGNRFRLQLDGENITGRVVVPNTGSWSRWITVKTRPIRVAAGNHVLRLQTHTGGFDLDYIAVTPVDAPRYVRLTWFQNPPENGDLETLAAHFHDYILSGLNDDVRDELRSRGAPGPFLQYIHVGVIQNPWSCTAEPTGNQVAYRPGDFCRISQEHPDWFLRDEDGEPIATDGFYFMDPGNTEWRAFWIERVRALHEERGWDGLFLDNIDATLGRFKKIGRYPAKYPTDARWQEAVQTQLRSLAVNYFEPEDIYVVGNITAVADPTPWFNYLQYLDGAMEEGWGTDWDDRYYSVERWEEHLQRVERTQALGKLAMLVAQGTEEDYERERFAFASYLLVTDGLASFRYTHQSEYREIWLYKNYSFDLGAPKGPRYRDGHSWRRDFERGYVRVNPATHSSEITVLEP